ncbi:MAG: amidohydrolase family protein [Acidobacteria bacterium]|nr:amidohydrolase family protein [Acidobacteriota bacterium]
MILGQADSPPMKPLRIPPCARAALALLPFLGAAADPPALAVRNARIVTVTGPVLENGTLLVRNGLIEALGGNVPVPANAWVLDGAGLTVYPGLMDALSTLAAGADLPQPGAASPRNGPSAPSGATPARGPEDRPLTTSWIKAADTLQAADRNIDLFRQAGFTGAATFPTRGIFGGHGAVINLASAPAGKMVVEPSVGLYAALATGGAGSFPSSLMGSISYIRQIYADAAHYVAMKEAYAANARGRQRPAYDRALEGVLEARRLLLPGSRAVEIERSLRLAAELKVRAVLYGGHEAYRVTEPLKQSGMPILVSVKWPERDPNGDPDEVESLRQLRLRAQAPGSPAALAQAGVRFAFYSDGLQSPDQIKRGVRRAIENGLDETAALRAMTLAPAEIFGVADRLGSIEPGKIANLVIADGPLFAETTRIRYVVVDGVKYEPVQRENAR